MKFVVAFFVLSIFYYYTTTGNQKKYFKCQVESFSFIVTSLVCYNCVGNNGNCFNGNCSVTSNTSYGTPYCQTKTTSQPGGKLIKKFQKFFFIPKIFSFVLGSTQVIKSCFSRSSQDNPQSMGCTTMNNPVIQETVCNCNSSNYCNNAMTNKVVVVPLIALTFSSVLLLK